MSAPNINDPSINELNGLSLQHRNSPTHPVKLESKELLNNLNTPSNHASIFSWPSLLSENNHNDGFMDVFDVPEFDMTALMNEPIWAAEHVNHNITSSSINPLECSFDNLFAPWNSNLIISSTSKDDWSMNTIAQQMDSTIQSFQPLQCGDQPDSFIFPQTHHAGSQFHSLTNGTAYRHQVDSNQSSKNNNHRNMHHSEVGSPLSKSLSESTSSENNIYTPPNLFLSQITNNPEGSQPRGTTRRRSNDSSSSARTYRRRTSSHPSVASVVSLSAHEPIARIIEGIEHITFLYSHDRLVKEYTVRTDVNSVSLSMTSTDFRALNAIYPRANVSREEYDGNRWEYETSCNKLGWEICWLNQNQLCGHRGLIQRAVDAYRNRHAEMRSRRVTRQEKVANGTLRKRRAKKGMSTLI